MRAPKFQKLMNFKKINNILKDYVIKNKYKIIYIFKLDRMSCIKK